jgi:flagellar hook-associated protein 2
MSTFTYSGLISGLDTSSMITALMNAEKLPLVRLQNQQTALKQKQSAFGELRSVLADLEAAAKRFTKDAAGSKRTASSSNTTVLSVTSSAGADAASYQVTVNHLATSTRATSTAAMGRALTGADLGTALSSLPLPGTVTAGGISMVVDGKIVKATIGDPATTTLGDALDAISTALTSQVNANEGGSGATVTASIVDNKIQLALSGTSTAHNVSFGVSGDTSNALGILGLSGTGTTSLSSTTPFTGRSALGVTQTTVALDSAGLTGLASGTGTLSINGVGIAYDSTTDSLSTIIGRINASNAGVVASVDRTNDRLVLTARNGGASPMAIEDTGTLATALHLAPNTTDAQVLGTQAQVTIDGRAYTSDTNKLTGAIGGLSISLLAEGTSTITVTPDEAGTVSAVQDFVNAYNTLVDKVASLTLNEKDQAKGPLALESDLRALPLTMRRSLLGVSGVATAYKSLSEIGVTTGAAGAAKGTTNHLQLSESKLKDALANDPGAVANLLNAATGAIAPLQATIASWTKTGGRLDKSVDAITSQVSELSRRQDLMQEMLDLKQTALEKKFANMEATLAKLQGSQASTTSSSSTSSGG